MEKPRQGEGDHETGQIPQLTGVEPVSDGWIKKYILSYTMPDGTAIEYESVSRKGLEEYTEELSQGHQGHGRADAVCIVPRTIDNELVLIKEFRYPLNNWCIAFPAGLVADGEDILTCVSRELMEEIGYDVVCIDGKPKVKPLPQAGYSSAGMSDESVLVVYALVEKKGDPTPEPTEFIETLVVRIDDIARFLEENKTPIGTRCQLILTSFAREHNAKQEAR